MNKEIPSRLKKARESAGLSITEAAKRLGFSNYQTLSNIENGGREVKASELTSFARTYFCNIHDLLMQDCVRPSFAFLWRNPPTTEDQRKEVESEIFLKCEQYQLLENLLGFKSDKGFIETSEYDVSTNYRLNQLAKKTRTLLGLGNRPSLTLRKVLEEDFGVKILFLSLSQGSAVSLVHENCGRAIVINKKESPWRKNYDLAHELFHIILWKVFPPDNLKNEYLFSEIEKKAEKFASILLLPEEELRQETYKLWEPQKRISYSDIVEIAVEFGVSTKALLYRYANLGYIKWEEADKIANDEELAELSREKRYSSSEDINISERFITLAIRCLRKGLVSRGKFSELVDIDRDEIDDFIEKQGLMESEGKFIKIENMAS